LNPKQDWVENAKRNAALEAAKLVKTGFTIGLGSGSTAAYAINQIGKRVRNEKLRITAVPTSYQAYNLAVRNRIPITTLDEHPRLDLAIDGADQVDEELNLIKGMGGALAREKIVATAAKKLIIIADESKIVKTLGEHDQPVPVETLPFAAPIVMRNLKQIGGKATLREGIKKVGPVITDNGNVIIDACFGPIHKPAELERELKALTGVVETGLFVNMTDKVYVGNRSSVRALVPKR